MTIYHTANDRTPYTYLIGWSHLDKWYYGVRYAKGCHPDDLWNPYKTSSDIVNSFVAENGDPDVIDVRKTFNSIEAARSWEERVQRRMSVITSPRWINKSYGFGPKTLNKLISAKDINSGEMFLVTKEEFDSNPNLVGIMKGVKNPRLSQTRKERNILPSTKGTTKEERDALGYKPITGRPKGIKTSDVGKKNMSASKKGKARVKNIETGVVFYTEKNDPNIGKNLIIFHISQPGQFRPPHSQKTKDKIKSAAQNRVKHYCECCDRVIGASNWDRHLKSKKHLSQLSININLPEITGGKTPYRPHHRLWRLMNWSKEDRHPHQIQP